MKVGTTTLKNKRIYIICIHAKTIEDVSCLLNNYFVEQTSSTDTCWKEKFKLSISALQQAVVKKLVGSYLELGMLKTTSLTLVIKHSQRRESTERLC